MPNGAPDHHLNSVIPTGAKRPEPKFVIPTEGEAAAEGPAFALSFIPPRKPVILSLTLSEVEGDAKDPHNPTRTSTAKKLSNKTSLRSLLLNLPAAIALDLSFSHWSTLPNYPPGHVAPATSSRKARPGRKRGLQAPDPRARKWGFSPGPSATNHANRLPTAQPRKGTVSTVP